MTERTLPPDRDPVRRYLDGELEATDLPDGVRGEARAWDRLLAAVRAEHPRASAPAWLEDRIMGEIEALPAPGRLVRAWQWLVRPRPFQVPPLAVGMAAAALAALLLVPRGGSGPSEGMVAGPPAGASTDGEPVVFVQFVLEAPGARTVAVGGDFDDWQGSHTLSDPDGDGVWTGRVPMKPGVHSYMFLVDGDDWVTDPEAQRYADDGFGNRNAILALTDPTA